MTPESVRALGRPNAYPGHVEEVEVRETRNALLFLAGDRVYERSRSRSPGRRDRPGERRRTCEEELRLNRRASRSTYLGVLPVTREDDGSIVLDGGGRPLDWVVERARLPADRMLDALLEREAAGEEELERVAGFLVRFHERALTGPAVNRRGLVRAIRSARAASLERLEALLASADGPPALEPTELEHLRARAGRLLDERRELFERRVADWRIRDGHGDLSAGKVCLVGEDVVVLGCAALDRDLRCGDVAHDLAGLAVDLDRLGRPAAAEHVVAAYAELAGDPDVATLVRFYAAHRALARATSELEVAADPRLGAGPRTAARAAARRYGRLTLEYAG